MTIVFADDDKDDHLIFAKILSGIPVPTRLISVFNGERLMDYLSTHQHLPDVIFLDLNMPRKNGSECLLEIKKNERTRQIPVIVYSNSFHKPILDLLYQYGAFFCIRKSYDTREVKKIILFALETIAVSQGTQPAREKFVLGFVE